MTCYISAALHRVGNVNGAQTAGCAVSGAPQASARPGG